jgi:peptidoglycan hydrolase-like protein with peptidoglycan-binding domain
LLASLGYLPVSWAPDGMKPGTALDAQLAALEQPAAGTFAWRWAGSPPSLVALWQPGVSTAMETGALMAFESQQGLAVDGVAGPAVWSSLLGAATDPGPLMNQHGYTYALASETVPESLTVWHNGAVVDQAPANTGISAAPTPLGTWPVYERLQSQIMRGTNPDGSTYADPVQWVAYFNGSDAIHYIARGSYGYPQSVGCVEVSYTTGETVWPYLTYGSLVTVAP